MDVGVGVGLEVVNYVGGVVDFLGDFGGTLVFALVDLEGYLIGRAFAEPFLRSAPSPCAWVLFRTCPAP